VTLRLIPGGADEPEEPSDDRITAVWVRVVGEIRMSLPIKTESRATAPAGASVGS